MTVFKPTLPFIKIDCVLNSIDVGGMDEYIQGGDEEDKIEE